MVSSHAAKSPDLRLAVSGSMVAGLYESSILMVDQATTAAIRQPRTEVTDQSFAALDIEMNSCMSTSQTSLLLWPVKT